MPDFAIFGISGAWTGALVSRDAPRPYALLSLYDSATNFRSGMFNDDDDTSLTEELLQQVRGAAFLDRLSSEAEGLEQRTQNPTEHKIDYESAAGMLREYVAAFSMMFNDGLPETATPVVANVSHIN